jgi:hypothetical protein
MNFSGLVNNFEAVVAEIIIPIFFGLALLYFLLGVLKYMKDSGDQAKRKDAQKMIWWGLIFMATMVSTWTLVRIVSGTIGQKGISVPKTPTKVETNIPQDLLKFDF